MSISRAGASVKLSLRWTSALLTLDGQGRTRFPAAKSKRWTSSSSSVGDGPPSSSSSPALIFPRWKVLRSFSGTEIVSREAEEAGGLSPGNEENEAGRVFRPEKPYLPLSIEGKRRKLPLFSGKRAGKCQKTARNRTGGKQERRIAFFAAPWYTVEKNVKKRWTAGQGGPPRLAAGGAL